MISSLRYKILTLLTAVYDPVRTKPRKNGSMNHTQVKLVTSMIAETDQAVVHISGSAEYIRNTTEQLAWLTATLIVPHEGKLTVSCIYFPPQRTDIDEVRNGFFHLCLWEQVKLPEPDGGPGQCWTSLFTQSVLAYGFPLAGKERPDGMRGLEVPFEIMAAFSGVRFPVLLGQRLAFASKTNILIPEVSSNDSIQWHLD